MIIKQLLTSMTAAGAIALTAPAMAATNIVTNGGFETGNLSGWSGTLSISPYSGVYCPGAGIAPENNCELFAGTNGSAISLSQVLSTVAGQSYSISFYFVSDGSTPTSFSAAFGNQSLYSVTSPVVGTSLLNFSGTAVGTSTALTFSFLNDPGYFYLDGVSVTAAVPEPGTFALAGVGLVGLLTRRRWLSRQT